MTKDQTTVFVLDDEARVAKAISQTVLSLNVRVLTFSNPLECLEALKNTECDLLVTDVNMPHMNGLKVLQEAKEIRPLIKVIVVTGYGDIPMAVRAVQQGAVNFFEKPLNEETFIPALKNILFEGAKGSEGAKLTTAEAQVLKYIASGKSNKEIAFLLGRSIRTVENHRHRVMKKLKADSPAALTKIAISLGLSSV